MRLNVISRLSVLAMSATTTTACVRSGAWMNILSADRRRRRMIVFRFTLGFLTIIRGLKLKTSLLQTMIMNLIACVSSEAKIKNLARAHTNWPAAREQTTQAERPRSLLSVRFWFAHVPMKCKPHFEHISRVACRQSLLLFSSALTMRFRCSCGET